MSAAAAVVKQHVLSLCSLSNGGNKTLCNCRSFFPFFFFLFFFASMSALCTVYPDQNFAWADLNECLRVNVCVGVTSLSPSLLKHSGLLWQLTFSRVWLPSVKSNLSLAELIELGLQYTGAVPVEQTTRALKTTSGCLLILLQASVLVLIQFNKSGQLGNRFCIELGRISSLRTNAASLMPEKNSAVVWN